MINFECPSCFAPFRVPESAAGRKGTCKTCGTSVTVPAVQEEVLEIQEWTDDLIDDGDYISPPPRPVSRPTSKSGTRSKKKKRKAARMDDSTWYRGFWIRVVASVIDSIILFILWVPFLFLMNLNGAIAMSQAENELAETIVALILGMTITLMQQILYWLYYAILHSSAWQATVGKKLLGLVVVDEHGDRISFGRATGRYAAILLSTLLFGIGLLMVGWTERKRGLHDMLAGTYVITPE